MCHYYNFYFAHTAGGRMIGKQMSALLLDKKTLDFYKVGFL
jgi:heme oxygenase